MGKKDILLQEYMSNRKRFADVFNGALFDGKDFVKAENLRELDPTEIFVLDKELDGKSANGKRTRDLLKEAVLYEDNVARYLLLGIENQDKVHYGMVVRDQLYNAMRYEKQMKSIVAKHKADKDLKDGKEFLSHMTKEDRLKPVITITIYWGSEEWDGARTLHQLLSVQDKDILKWVNDYKMNLIVPNEIEDFSKFKTEFGMLMEFITASNDKDKLWELVQKDERYQKLETDTAIIMRDVVDMKIEVNKEGKETNMCKGLKDLIEKEREEVREEMCKGLQDLIEKEREEVREEMCKGLQDLIEKEREEVREEMCKGLQDLLDEAKAEGRAEKDAEIAEKNAEIAELKKQLEALQEKR